MLKRISIFLLAGLIIVQFIHPRRNKAAGEQTNYIGRIHAIPEDVHAILAKACFDCHSNNTRYRWYFNTQPADWWLTKHISDGKKELNFDEYNSRSLRYQYHKLEETIDMVKDDKMPLNTYIWLHKDAKLTSDEKSKLSNWAKDILDSMKIKYPLDSLIRKR